MPLPDGSKLGPYEILGSIGAGGMGEVYRALDTRLGRTVAIKVLRSDLSARPDLESRFAVEARAIASLNHPSICALFDVGQHDGMAFMVMEHLAGETLADRLDRGPLPLAEALGYGADITHALEQAHLRGVAHRDLKPANIMLTKGGLKLLDFGLARLREPVPANDGLTLTATSEGTILGTPQYMSPEQAQGKATDTRTDIFAFASVLYEMIAGQKAFRGENQQEVWASIVRCELPPPIETAPEVLNRTLKICWAKDPDDRWQSAGDLRRELLWIAQTPQSVSAQPPQAAGMGRREMLAWSAAGVAAVAAGAGLVRHRDPASQETLRARFRVAPPSGGNMQFFSSPPAISPDGKLLAFTAVANTGVTTIWIRALDSLGLREIPDTERAEMLFWSPDSRSLAFFANDKLKRIPITGGVAQVVCDSPVGVGGAWNQAGTIVFSRGRTGAICQVPADGGTPAEVTSMAEMGHRGHWYPSWLPGGRQFLFTGAGSQPDRQGVYVASLDSRQVIHLFPVATKARYVAPGYLLFSQDTKAGIRLMAQRFDADRLKLQGDPFVVADDLWGFQSIGVFDASDSGVVVFAEPDVPHNQLTWFDRSGKALGTVGDPGPFIHMQLSPDERRVLLERLQGTGDLWVLDLARNVPTRLTSGPGWAFFGIWSPDGTRVVYSLSVPNSTTLTVRDPSGTGQAEQLLKIGEGGPGSPSDWSPDGRYLVYVVQDSNSSDIWLWPLSPAPDGRAAQAVPYLRSPFMKGQGRVSPDGRWMAYVSMESQTAEVYVSPFPNAGTRERISTAGGSQPQWRADGRELFYFTTDHTLMAVPVQPGASFQPGVAVPLFQAHPAEYYKIGRNDYAPSHDGRKFLINTRAGDPVPKGIQVLVGWQPAPGQ